MCFFKLGSLHLPHAWLRITDLEGKDYIRSFSFFNLDAQRSHEAGRQLRLWWWADLDPSSTSSVLENMYHLRKVVQPL